MRGSASARLNIECKSFLCGFATKDSCDSTAPKHLELSSGCPCSLAFLRRERRMETTKTRHINMDKPIVTDPITMAISGKLSEPFLEFDDSALEVTVMVEDIADDSEAMEIPS